MCQLRFTTVIIVIAPFVMAGLTSSARASEPISPQGWQRHGGTTNTIDQAEPWERIQREVPHDPPAPPEVLRQRRTEPGRVATVGVYTSVQVNVDADGNNIISDAANEPSIAVDPNDPAKMAIGWRQFHSVESDHREAGYAYSSDGGATWVFPGVLEPGVFRSDPVLGYDAEGNFYYSSLAVGPYSADVFKSSDGGMTWGPPTYGFGGDKQWMTIDRTTGIGRGNIYQQWRLIYTCCPPFDFTRSTNGGLSFDGPFQLTPSIDIATLDVGPDGTLYVAGNDGTDAWDGLVLVRSANAKDPLQTPTPDLVVHFAAGFLGYSATAPDPNPGGLTGQTWVATDHSDGPTRGNVYVLASMDPPGPDPLDVIFARSTDGGETWSDPIRVNNDRTDSGAWQWFGTMSVAPNGRIDAVWNDTRRTGVVNLSELFYAYSSDAGETWTGNIPIAPVFDSWVGWPDNQTKIGDYYHMISSADTVSLAYAATYNGEQDVYFLRFPVDCNGNGIDDSTDIADGTSEDCNSNGIPDECEEDCDANGVPDECDIAQCPPDEPWCQDCQPNGVLDGCEPDCNENSVADECDISTGTSEDCNLNGVPDECDLASGTSQDCNEDGFLDDCVPPIDAPQPENPSVAKNRYLSVVVPAWGPQTALQVTFVSLPGYEYAEGRTMWVQEPFAVTESSGSATPTPPPTFWAAELGCNPHYTDWSSYGTIDFYDSALIPGCTFEIRAIDAICDPAHPGSYSAPLEVTMSAVGDLVGVSCGNCPCDPPQGVVDFVDISAVVEKFKNVECVPGAAPGVPRKARADLINSTTELPLPDHKVDFVDISYCVDAFGNQATPLPGPPLDDPCPAR